MIPYGRQEISRTDIEAVVAVLQSDFLTQGPVVPRFEQAVSARCGARHAVAVNSGTSALHVACLALDLGPGDVLWTVPNTFVASANCGRYCGAGVDFVDIDPNTWNLSVPALREKLTRAKRDGKLPKVVVPVHLGGQPTEQEAIWDLAQEFGFKVLEDAAHSFGASRNGEPVGSCKWSHIAVFSFHPVKIITTGEGGMAMTNDDELAWRMTAFRSHGITRDPGRMQRKPAGPWYYEQVELGYNYRMTDLQAALGLSQFVRLDEFLERRNALARRYHQKLADLPLQLPTVQRENRSAFHLYVVRLRSGAVSKPHREVFDSLREQGIGVNRHYMPVHLQPYYRNLGFGPGLCPEAERYYAEAISLPMYPGLTETQQAQVINALRGATEA
jgi:UDP-4-amino-4,6-dideoxy-N-acetyl-beta-L-altrosamine transaminase